MCCMVKTFLKCPPGSNEMDEEVISQWCDDVIHFSSQYGSESSISYTVANVAGPSTTFPSYGDFTQCCVMRTYGAWWKRSPFNENYEQYERSPLHFNSHDFIELAFEKKVYPLNVKVYETYNPGAVVRILCCNKSAEEMKNSDRTRWFELYRGEPVAEPAVARIFTPDLKVSPFPTNLIRLELNQTKCEYYTELDAVELVGQTRQSDLSDIGSSVDPEGYEQNGYIPDSTICDKQCKCCDKPCKLCNTHNMAVVLKGMDNLELEETKNGCFESLPEEVILMILSLLDLVSLCTLAKTNHLFYKYCYDTLQYRDLNLQPYWHLVNDATLAGFMSRCYHLNRLNLSWCKLKGHSLQTFVSCCGRRLVSLRLSGCMFVTGPIIQEIADCCPNLQDLDLSGCQKMDNSGFASIRKLSRLERLNLYRTTVDTYSLATTVKQCPELQHLNLGACVRLTDLSVLVNELSTHCKKLKSLDLWRSRHFSPACLMSLASACPDLEELDLGWCFELSSFSGCFIHLAEHCKKLRKLFVTANRSVCDRDLEALANHCKKLEQLDILGTREVSGDTVNRLLSECPNMIFLDVSFCLGMDDVAVNELRRNFPKVAIKKSFQT